LKSAFDKHGPVAVAIHVNERWARYKQGIYDDRCEGGINHAVVAVGYGYDEPSNKDYWIIRNSWGKDFGEKGYIRMRRNNKNMCKIANDPVWVA
jgi:C1A family cysteine protease